MRRAREYCAKGDRLSIWGRNGDFESAVRNAVQMEREVIRRPDLRAAAVLIPIVMRDERPHFVLTKRAMTVASHKGQISFPGGVVEKDDRDLVHTALREAKEEIDLDETAVEVVGLLSDMVTSTGYVVSPVVGFLDPQACFAADPAEVAEIFEAPIELFLNPAHKRERVLTHKGIEYQDICYDILGREVWGVTGRIITMFLDQLFTNPH